MGMQVHLYDLDDEYVGSSDMEGSAPDSLERNGRIFRRFFRTFRDTVVTVFVTLCHMFHRRV
jgi:hypothetical protein